MTQSTVQVPPARRSGSAGKLPMFTVRESTYEELLPQRTAAQLRVYRWAKSSSDRAAAFLLLLMTAPIVMLCMALVRLTTRGPALYSQTRVGQFGRIFTIYKIRTMYHECESQTGPKWSVPGDPRVTFLGRILRKLHLDELPQLWNVLRGEMSLIGPRPERPEIAGKLHHNVPNYDWRSAVKPGITGYAQIHLPPDTSVADVRHKVALDRYYIQNLSLWLDLKILVCTLLKVVGLFPWTKRSTN